MVIQPILEVSGNEVRESVWSTRGPLSTRDGELPMLDKLSKSFEMAGRALPMMAAVILTIKIPSSLLQNFISDHAHDPDSMDALRVTMLIEGLASPLYIAGSFVVLHAVHQGKTPQYGEAMGTAFRVYGRLLVARIVVNIITALGMLALVIPGIILAVRYALVDTIVVLEGAKSGEARKRSTEMIKGSGWAIFAVGAIWFFGIAMAYVVTGVAVGLAESLDNMVVSTIIDCVIEVFGSGFVLTMLYLYWVEAWEKEQGQGARIAEVFA
jgi:hypothetical protein